eukprot:7082290-Prymnesium_polylepis.3
MHPYLHTVAAGKQLRRISCRLRLADLAAWARVPKRPCAGVFPLLSVSPPSTVFIWSDETEPGAKPPHIFGERAGFPVNLLPRVGGAAAKRVGP